MDAPKKCEHPTCVCVVPKDGDFGDFCSAHCRDASGLTDLKCECGHDLCIHDAARPVRG